jgi:hypothetical protein
LTLGMTPSDARDRLDLAVTSGRPFKTVEELISVIFARPS